MNFADLYKKIVDLDSIKSEEIYTPVEEPELDEASKSKPDFLDMDKDGDKEEPMKKALKDKEKKTEESVEEPVDEETVEETVDEDAVEECPSEMGMNAGQPDHVNMNVNMSGAGEGGIRDLLNILKDLSDNDALPGPRGNDSSNDDDLDIILKTAGAKPHSHDDKEDETEEAFQDATTEPNAEYQDVEFMTKDLAGGLNRPKKAFAKAQDGDNAMAVESLKEKLSSLYQELKLK